MQLFSCFLDQQQSSQLKLGKNKKSFYIDTVMLHDWKIKSRKKNFIHDSAMQAKISERSREAICIGLHEKYCTKKEKNKAKTFSL